MAYRKERAATVAATAVAQAGEPDWAAMGPKGDDMPLTHSSKVLEIVHDSGDNTSQDRVVEIDTCVYAMETYPKGYQRTSAVGEMPNGGQWGAEWHPQGTN